MSLNKDSIIQRAEEMGIEYTPENEQIIVNDLINRDCAQYENYKDRKQFN